MWEVLRSTREAFGRAIERFGEFLQTFDPTSWVAWLQVASLLLAIAWTFYQFTRARRLSEGEVENWIEEHLDDKPRNLKNERGEYLACLNSSIGGSFISSGLRALRARARMFVLFLLRIVLVRKRKKSASHAMLLFDAGMESKAAAEFSDIAADFEKKADIYEKQVRAKRLEACNAYLYAGRVASELADTQATKRAYDNVLRLNDGDADAYKLIGKQYLDAGDIKAALAEYGNIVTHAANEGDRATEAEGYRLQATAHMKDNRTGRALRILGRSEKTEPPNNHRGLAETQKMLGDVFVRQGRTAAAIAAYTASVTQYGHAGDQSAAVEVQKILDRLGKRQSWLSRLFERIGEFMLRLAKQLHDRD